MIKLESLNLVKKFKLERFEKTSLYIIGIILFLFVVVLVQLLSLRLDLSKGRAYSLSSASHKLIGNLDDIVNITFYTSKKLPTKLLPLQREVTDFLGEYKNVAKGKIVLRLLYPDVDEQAKTQAQEAGLPEMQFSQIEQDQYVNTVAYFGIVIKYGGKTEIIPQATQVNNLEYDITASIFKLTRKDGAKIGMIGFQAFAPEMINPMSQPADEYSVFKRVIGQQYQTEDVLIATESARVEIDKANKALIVLDNGSKEYSKIEIDAIKKYLSKKGNVIVFVDRYWGLSQMNVSPAKHNLFTLISDYGITVNDDLVLSKNSELVNIAAQEGNMQITPYLLWIKTNNFTKKSTSYFSNINSLFFPWTSSLSIKSSEKLEINDLASSTDGSWTEKAGGLPLQPDKLIEYLESKKEMPKMSSRLLIAESQLKFGKSGKLIVIPSSYFLKDNSILRSSQNIEFALNLVNDLASDGALTGIAQREVGIYPLHVDNEHKEIIKYFLMLALPVLFAIYGYLRLSKKKQ